MKTYWLTGCGVTIQATKESMADWVIWIIDRGGVPAIEEIR